MKYIANPVEVEAHKIVSVGKPNADCSVNVALESGDNEVATAGMCSRYVPVPGDYWVIQSDGYIYLNPKEVFERKYRAAWNAPDERVEIIAGIIAAEFDAVAREARLDEAKWWASGGFDLSGKLSRERIAELESK